MRFNRRTALRSAMLAAGGAAVAGTAATPVGAGEATALPIPVPRTGAHLVLLGTAAGPVPMTGRTGVSTALVVDGHIYLIDFGHGAFEQFERSGLDIGDLDRIFVTHMHSDHLADLFTLLWLRFGGVDPMTHPVHIHGPASAGELPDFIGPPGGTVNPENPTPGMADFFRYSLAAAAYDINTRMRDEGWPDIRKMFQAHEIPTPDVGASANGNVAPPMKPFEVMSDERVKVSAILVEHPPIFPSYGFRFDTRYGSVVVSGDTTITPNMVTLARGADVLVHEVIDLNVVRNAGGLSPEQIQHHERAHSDVTRVGTVAAKAGVKTLVLNHLAPGTKEVPDLLWLTQAQRGFRGRVIVGNDLMRIPVG
ncbi:MBL fold metallo-hydrolase [Gordonia sp. PKS22-38]|uniref:MBL fold metallo-hydrolase n=1 Tax=Gordonia prachuapensis TaxID=3115651 RepID=A0ABU7N007_9ACTN|nr:MBL fold metallo-hydrolase [Gordonia sp. PKS22-38]